jgi:hypothetical protein
MYDDDVEMPPPRPAPTDALERIADRIARAKANPRADQATYHQDKAVKCAEALGDVQSVGIYLRLYARYDHAKLDRCRDWVLSRKTVQNPGRLFVASYRRFLRPQDYPQKAVLHPAKRSI